VGLWRWFVDSQFPRSSRRGMEQDDRRRGYNDARAGRPRRGTSSSYKKGYAAGSLPTAVALPARSEDS